MIPELKTHYDHAKSEMDDAINFLKREFSHVRAGKATPSLLDGIKVNYYGSQTPLNQLANVSAPEARMLMVQPYDKGSMQDIEKAIMSSGLGLNPNNDGSVIRIPLPMLTEERRQELVKHSRDVAEKARISIRNYRREANENIKKTVDEENLSEDHKYAAEEEIQNLTNESIKKVDELLEKKEKEILTV